MQQIDNKFDDLKIQISNLEGDEELDDDSDQNTNENKDKYNKNLYNFGEEMHERKYIITSNISHQRFIN